MPIKVYDLAKEYKKTNTEMLAILDKLGYKKLGSASDLDEETAGRIRAAIGENSGGGAPARAAGGGGNGAGGPAVGTVATPARPQAAASGRGGAPAVASARPSGGAGNGGNAGGGNGGGGNGSSGGSGGTGGGEGGGVVDIPSSISVKELAERFNVPAGEVQKVLMGMGVLAALNQRLAPDAVQRIAQKMGRTVRIAAAPATPASPAAPAAPAGARPGGAPGTGTARPTGTSKPMVKGKAGAGAGGGTQVLTTRPPVVTIMGHVDHGKTTLLDTLRKASVASGEAGGITQHIGAYQIEANGQRITFLDTPGHAAFSAMRSRGARVTDIVVIVVAADDSIMPQTEEAIRIAKEAQVPIIIAVNKIDLPAANPERVLTDLTSYELVPEAFGGDIPTVNISAKTGEGVGDLLDMISLVSEVVVDPKADPHAPASGTVIEAKVDKGRGAVATLLIQQGTLRASDVVVAGTTFGKVRTMGDERGSKLVKAGPSSPIEITGLNAVPEAGDHFEVVKDEREARALVQEREQRGRDQKLNERNLVTLEALYKTLRQGPVKELNVVIKGDVQGSAQAVRDSLLDLGNDEVRVRILSTGVGPISESDVLLASSDKDQDEKNSLVIGFNVGTAGGVDKKAEQEHVQIKTYSIIYELIDAVKDAMVALLPPIFEEVTLGRAEVRQMFRLPGGRSIAGSHVQDGIVRRNAKARVFRGKDLLFTGDIDTLKRFKDDAREVAAGYECGMTLRDYNDIQVGDIIECFEMRQIPREL